MDNLSEEQKKQIKELGNRTTKNLIFLWFKFVFSLMVTNVAISFVAILFVNGSEEFVKLAGLVNSIFFFALFLKANMKEREKAVEEYDKIIKK
jgi:hypothetical protein